MFAELTSTRDHAGCRAPAPIKNFRIVLIKPSKYDDDGYVIRFWKGVYPSNSLNVLYGLAHDVQQRRAFPEVDIHVDTFDETAEKVPVEQIARWSRRPNTKLLVCLVGVQTNQFPRALVLGKQFRRHGIDVMIGGFHTSGTVNMLGEQEPDIQELVQEKISVVAGEVENEWQNILADCLNGRLKPIYSFAQDLQNLIDISSAPLPIVSPKTMKHFALQSFGTVDTSRGCPFACSFCTIINVQGRKMRERSPEWIAEVARRNYLAHGVNFYFFTDDNFARKKLWRETFEALIRLREEENIKISFMMQVDLAKKPKDFVALAARAGCGQVFIGMESVNPENLKAEGKAQNKVDEYIDIIREWHDAGILVQTGYIVGLPFDTKEQIPEDIRYLTDVIGPDIGSFFMMTPLPGSQDHKEMKERGEWMDPDFNKRDSFHATTKHSTMTAEEWTAAYQGAWGAFYSKANMKKILSRWTQNPHVYWRLLFILMWYKNAALIENQHPMVAGFFRLKDRLTRRPGYAVDSLLVHAMKRAKEIFHLLVAWARFFKELEEVWLETRPRSEREKRFFEQIEKIQGEIWQTLKIAEWRQAYNDARAVLPAKARELLDPFEDLSSKILLTRKDLDRFLRQWSRLDGRLQKLRRRFEWKDEPAGKWIEQLRELHRSTAANINVKEWRDIYPCVAGGILSRAQRLCLKFDALNNRVVYSKQDLQKFWSRTAEHLRGKRFWTVQAWKLSWKLPVNFVKELYLTTTFAQRFLSSYRS
jgi:radical SAM superfamily enzyme YgiQ (UPF0313 family)